MLLSCPWWYVLLCAGVLVLGPATLLRFQSGRCLASRWLGLVATAGSLHVACRRSACVCLPSALGRSVRSLALGWRSGRRRPGPAVVSVEAWRFRCRGGFRCRGPIPCGLRPPSRAALPLALRLASLACGQPGRSVMKRRVGSASRAISGAGPSVGSPSVPPSESLASVASCSCVHAPFSRMQWSRWMVRSTSSSVGSAVGL